jgi:hypothetical protein
MKILIISALLIILDGCTTPTPPPQPKQSKKADKAEKEVYRATTNYSNQYQSCYSGDTTISCEIKKAKKNLRLLNWRIEDTLKGIGGCCTQY